MRDMIPVSDAELRLAFDRAELALIGWTFERAIAHRAMRLALENQAHIQRRAQAREARRAALEHQILEAA